MEILARCEQTQWPLQADAQAFAQRILEGPMTELAPARAEAQLQIESSISLIAQVSRSS